MPAWSGFWDDEGDGAGHSLLVDKNPLNDRFARVLRRRSMKSMRAIIDSITTSNTVGSNITETRVQGDEAATNLGDPAVNGGLVTIETVTLRTSGSVTAAEVTEIDEVAQRDKQPTYPTDAAGNGTGVQHGESYEPGLG